MTVNDTELDWITHPMKSELNFPIGDKTPLDADELTGVGWAERWEVPLHLWDGMFGQTMQVRLLYQTLMVLIYDK